MAPLSVTLLGGFQARLDSAQPLHLVSRKAQAVLAYLALPPGRAHPRDKLAAVLWGTVPERQARKSLRQALLVLRKALGGVHPAVLRLEGDTVALDGSLVEVDVVAFERGVAEGTPKALARAAALYRGNLLDGLVLAETPFEEWLMAERERLRELAVEAMARLLAHQRTEGATDAAVHTALRLLSLDPCQEPVHRTLMRLYAERGRRGAALRHYQHCVGVLQRELGVEPEAETRQLYQEMLRRGSTPLSSDVRPSESSPPHSEQGLGVHAAPELPRPVSRLIGREPEQAQLRTALDSAWTGRGACVAIIGEAGVGKTRLLTELVADAAQRGARVLLGRSYEAEQILPFGPWVIALRSDYVTRDAEVLQALAPVWRAELARLLPEVGTPPASGGGDYLQLFEGIAELIRILAARRPLVLVLEDLHWADEMTVRLLAFLARRLQPLRALVLVTAREEEVGDVPVLRRALEDLSREQYLVTLPLGPLSRADTRTLVRTLARTGSDQSALEKLGAHVWLASEGNPFIAVESVQASEEAGTAEVPAGRSLPERVRVVLVRRLQPLSERSRPLVSAAAVIGREFDFALLQQAAGLDEREAAEGLEELVRRRVLHGVGERFDFTHDAIRQVALAEILPPRHKLLHRRVAEALEALHASNVGPHAMALAVHYRESEVWNKAASYLWRAGTQMVARLANREAVACYEQALDALGHLPGSRETVEQGIDIRLELHKALISLGEPQRTGANLVEAEKAARGLADQARLGRVAAHMTNYFWLAGESDRAVESGERARTIARALDDRALGIAAGFYLGQVYHFRGDYRRAIAVLRGNLEALDGDPTEDRFGLAGLAHALSRGWLAWSLSEVGEFPEGIARAEEALEIAQRADHAFSLADACRELGCLYLRKGEIPRALEVLERGLALCRSGELALWYPSIGSALGYGYLLAGTLPEAMQLLEQTLERAALLGIMAGHSLRSAWLGEAYLVGGRPTDALGLARRALELSRQRKERGNQSWVLRLLGEIASRRDPPAAEEAEDAYGQAIDLGEELGMRPLVAHCHLGLGTLYRRTGQREQAQEYLATATTMYREMDMRFWLERADSKGGDCTHVGLG